MKKKSLILVVILLIILLVLGFNYLIRYKYGMYGVNDPSYRAELDKLNQKASIDYCVDGIYSNDYIGVSLKCPSGLMAQEIYNGYHTTPKEGANFIEKKEKINVRDNVKKFFSVRLESEKFDLNNTYEYYIAGEDFHQIDSYKLINKAEAVTGPIFVKIENIKQITVGNNKYYTYSFTINKNRTDVFIIPRDNNYLDFRFYNQDKDFIENVLGSVKIIPKITH